MTKAPMTLLFALASCVPLAAGTRLLVGWEFDKDGDMAGWRPNSQHTADTRVAGGHLSTRVVDWDPFFTSPVFEVAARNGQWIETRMRASHSGQAEFFWSGTLKSQYGGFSPGKETHFELIGDGKWHVYRVHPAWEAEKKIIHVRLDLPRDKGTYGVDYVRIVEPPATPPVSKPSWGFDRAADGWSLGTDDPPQVRDGALIVERSGTSRRLVSPTLSFPAREHFFVSIRMAVDKGQTATLGFATDTTPGLQTHSFPLRADNRPHSYLLDLSGASGWRDQIRLLTFEPTDAAHAQAAIDFIRLDPKPHGEAELAIRGFGLADGLPRAGQRLTLAATITNPGGAPARDVRARLVLPPGLTTRAPLRQRLADVWYGEVRQLEWPIEAPRAMRDKAIVQLSARGLAPLGATASIEIAPGLGLPKARYVPEPKPAKTDCQVGVYYFPGFPTWAKWRPIADFPERKPLLGWYDEAKPEVADWQIKWAVEHGISFFAVDWYWCQGARHLEHWLHDAYFKSRYRRLLKFCLLWANHNPAKSHSEADLLKLNEFWLEHYFKRPEYLAIEGKPVVIIFTPYAMSRDMGTEAIAAAFRKMREQSRVAGLAGLYLIACTQDNRKTIAQLKAQGYDAVSGYNYPSLGAGGKRRAPFASLVPAYRQLWHHAADHGLWNAAADHRLLKEIPALSGGWDSRPWHGQRARVVHGRTPKLFERHCRDAKDFLDRRDGEIPPKLRMCLIEAWNEWGEGSYIGPHREYGFGYLEAVRRVFAPESPKPLPLTPRDVGLGPYDLPRPEAAASPKTAWDLTRPADRAAWRPVANARLDDAAQTLTGAATGSDVRISGPVVRIPADAFPWLVVEMRTSKPDRPQLFWSTTTAPASESNSIRFDVPGDGQFHTHRVRLADTPHWTGLITGLRFDPTNQPGVAFALRSIRFARSHSKEDN